MTGLEDLGALPAAPSVTTGAEAKTVADILTEAADLIEPEGAWTQGSWWLTNSGKPTMTARYAACMCVEGAIAKAAGIAPNRVYAHPAGIALMDVVPNNWELPEWNDAPERTQAEVVAALRAAAEKARTASSVGMEPEGRNEPSLPTGDA